MWHEKRGKILILTFRNLVFNDDQSSIILGEKKFKRFENQDDENAEIEEEAEEEKQVEGGEAEKEFENIRNFEVLQKQATRRKKMKKRYSTNHQIYAFKIGDIVTVVISAKNREVNDAPRMKAKIVGISHENRFKL